MQQRPGDGRQVGAVHERQRQQLDEHGDVVGVTDEAVRARRSPRRAASSAPRARSSARPAWRSPRSAAGWPAPPATSAGTPTAATKGRCRARTSTAAPTMTPVCSATMAPKIGSGAAARPGRRARAGAGARASSRSSGRRPPRRRGKARTTSSSRAQLHCESSISVERPGPNAARMPYASAGGWPLREPLVEHEQHRGARLVAEVAQDLPRRLSVIAPQPQLLFDVGQDLPAARVEHEAGELLGASARAGRPASAPAAPISLLMRPGTSLESTE